MKIIVGAVIAHFGLSRFGAFDNRMAYVLGLQRLGHEVYLIADVAPWRCVDSNHNPVRFHEWEGKRKFESLTKSYRVSHRCCLIYNHGEATHGMSLTDAVKVAKTADLLLNIDGRLKTPEILENVGCKAYIDINPAITQAYHAEYGIDLGFNQHQHFFSVGLNIGSPECGIPTCGRNWHGIFHPVVMAAWRNNVSDQYRRFTTISNWAGKHTFNFRGRFSGEKADQWRKFIDLPRKSTQKLEIALKIGAGYEADIKLFRKNGWVLSDPRKLRTFEQYRRYIASSRAEFSVANNRYAAFNTGWFSDRSARYLASGKPVLVQSTGIEDHLPTGKGLLTFKTVDEAVAGIEAINSDYVAHCRAARSIAEEYFDSDKVLSKMLDQIGV